MPDDRTVHFSAENNGSLWLFRPLTDTARAWVEKHTPDDAQWFGNAVVVEHRYIGAIIEGAANDGLHVRVK